VYAGDLERDTPAMTEPQSWVRVGASNLAGSDAALAEALQGLALEWTARLLVVLAAPHHNLEAVARELALELPLDSSDRLHHRRGDRRRLSPQ